MYIGAIMHTNLITVSPEASLVEANELIKKNKIEHLLVVDSKGKLVGILSDLDLKQYWASPATTLSTHELNYLLQKVQVGMIMVKTVVTVPTSTTIERAALIMQENEISALPVMEEDELVGIITSTDVMQVLLQAIGISDESARMSVFVKDSLGILADLSAALRDGGVNIQSLFCRPEEKFPGVTQMVLRVAKGDKEKAFQALTSKGYKVKDKYVKDITPYLPE